VLLSYFLFHANFFYYFLSLRHVVEILLNGGGAFIFALIGEGFTQISHLFKK